MMLNEFNLTLKICPAQQATGANKLKNANATLRLWLHLIKITVANSHEL